MKERRTQSFHRALGESAGKLSLRGGRLGNEAAALPDLIKTGLEANSFRSEQEGCSHCCCPSCSGPRGTWKTQARGDVP